MTTVAIGFLIVGLVIGVAIGLGGGGGTTTVTHVNDVARTVRGATRTVPVVRVKTVTKPRYVHVVRTQTQVRTVTVRAAAPSVPSKPVSAGGGGGGGGDNGAQYAGETCPEIGHSFNVTPGSDPEHDADNDGIACESEG